MNARRLASLAGTVAVTVIAAVASFDHMRVVAERAGQPALLAALLPFSVDGLTLVGALALGDGRRSRWSAWVAFILGVSASLAANVLAAPPGIVARVVSAWPAVALLVLVEVLARSGRKLPEVPAPEVAEVPSDTEVPPEVPPEVPAEPPEPGPGKRQRRPVAETKKAALALLAEGRTRKDAAARLGISERHLRNVLAGA